MERTEDRKNKFENMDETDNEQNTKWKACEKTMFSGYEKSIQ